jgi:CO/xanthine dehydrogenase FAD-binding subunit
VSLTNVKEYFTPSGKDEVLDLLKTYGDSALIVAGGSFVHGLDARDLLIGIDALIDIKNVGLNEVTNTPEGLSIGAMVTFTNLKKASEINDSAVFGAILDALEYPPLQIRNLATIGGNIASACPYFDLPTAIMALDARVQAQGPNGPRNIELESFFEGLFQNTLESDEFVTGVTFPQLPARSASAFIKLESNANDLAIVNVAVRVSLDGSGACEAARIVVGGGVAETPVRVQAAEAHLQGHEISSESIQQAAAAVGEELEPMSDHRASAAYRLAMARTLTQRALRRAVERLN